MQPTYHHAATVQYTHPAQHPIYPATGFATGQPLQAVQSFAQAVPGQPQFTFYTTPSPGAVQPMPPLAGYQVSATQAPIAQPAPLGMPLPPSVSYSPAYAHPGAMGPPPDVSIIPAQGQGQEGRAESESSYESSSEDEEGQEKAAAETAATGGARSVESPPGKVSCGHNVAGAVASDGPAADAEAAEATAGEPDVAPTVPSLPSSVSLPVPSVPPSMPASQQKHLSEVGT